MGIFQPAHFKFNSPIFSVTKKTRDFWEVHNFQVLNTNGCMAKCSMKDISKCIGEIGKSGSTTFSKIDLTTGFCQLLIHPQA
jgi:hypothetical protein